MHIEFFNPKFNHCFYVVDKTAGPSLSYWHPTVRSELTTYDVKKTVHDLLAELRPMLNTLLTELDSSTPWTIRIFKFSGPEYSLTRGTEVIEEFVTGDVIIINGVMQEPKLHPTWSVKR